MRQFVESLKRLYQNNKLSLEKIEELLQTNKISEEEKAYILNI